MTNILKKILLTVLAVVCALSLVACGAADKGDGETGMFCKKIGGVYTVYKYVDYNDENGNAVTTLDIGAELAKLEITEEVRIQAQAFNGNSVLTDVIVPDSVTKIEKGAFAGMKALQNLTIPFVGLNATGDASVGDTAPSANKAVDSERTIAHLFGDTSYDEGILQTINYGINSTTDEEGNTTTPSSACYMPVSLKKITVNAEIIPACAFNGLTKYVQIELNGAKVIGDYAFANVTQLAEISLPATVTKIGEGAFNKATSLKTVNLDKLVALEKIGDGAFEGTALTEIKMPTLTDTTKTFTIGDSSFKDVKALTELTLTASVKEIANYAFMGCEKLAKIISTGVATASIDLGNYAFADCEKLTTYDSAIYKTVGVNAFN